MFCERCPGKPEVRSKLVFDEQDRLHECNKCYSHNGDQQLQQGVSYPGDIAGWQSGAPCAVPSLVRWTHSSLTSFFLEICDSDMYITVSS